MVFMNNKFCRISAGVVLLLMTLLIFMNSAMNFEVSHKASDKFADMVQVDDHSDTEELKIIVRKIAHIIEYAMLGFATLFFCWSNNKAFHKTIFGYGLFYVLFIAVTDEHIQSFSDRTSSTSDIILDFCGALLGFFIGWLIIKAYAKIKSYFQRSEQEKKNGREKTTRA